MLSDFPVVGFISPSNMIRKSRGNLSLGPLEPVLVSAILTISSALGKLENASEYKVYVLLKLVSLLPSGKPPVNVLRIFTLYTTRGRIPNVFAFDLFVVVKMDVDLKEESFLL